MALVQRREAPRSWGACSRHFLAKQLEGGQSGVRVEEAVDLERGYAQENPGPDKFTILESASIRN